jgi:hypothetical protein
MTTARRLVLSILAPLVAACATTSPMPAPGDFLLRASHQPPFVVSWRLTDAPGSVSVDGILDIDGYVDRLEDATVELVGLDAGGRAVSHAATRLIPRAFSGDRLWPFRLRLTPAGGETRFAARVAEFNWKVEVFAGK